jgi:hypothetical protein
LGIVVACAPERCSSQDGACVLLPDSEEGADVTEVIAPAFGALGSGPPTFFRARSLADRQGARVGEAKASQGARDPNAITSLKSKRGKKTIRAPGVT